MKTLADVTTAEQIRGRLHSLCESDQRRWGVMTAGEMVCHLRGAFPMATGEQPAAPVHVGWRARTVKVFALRVPLEWPKNVPTVPGLRVGAESMQPTTFRDDRASMMEALEQFLAFTENRTPHSFFGAMQPGDWMRWGYLHTDHHLRQFGR